MDVETKERIRIKNKALYRDSKNAEELTKLASNKLLTPPRVFDRNIGSSGVGKGYSIVLAAKALGKSVIQLRSWIDKGYIPEPIHYIQNHYYYIYDVREMQIIRKHLYHHTKKGVSYLTAKSIGFTTDLFKEIHAYRENKYGTSYATKKA